MLLDLNMIASTGERAGLGRLRTVRVVSEVILLWFGCLAGLRAHVEVKIY